MHETTDIFLWANNTDGIKNELEIDVYVFSKNYTVYSLNFAPDLVASLRDLFLTALLNDIHRSAATGVAVRGFEDAEEERGIIQRTELQYVQRASEIIYAIESTDEPPEVFREQDHEFKRMKGMVARFSQPGSIPFYIAKLVSPSHVLTAMQSWTLSGNKMQPFVGEAAFRITPDSQVLITHDDIFCLNQTKFEKLFNYNVKKRAIADQKVKEIEANFSLSFAEGQDLQTIVKGKKRLINKLQKIEPSTIKQDELLTHAEEMGIELLIDDAGAIIILDDKDLDKFITLLNDDYIASDLTGIKYKIGSKKPLEPGPAAQVV